MSDLSDALARAKARWAEIDPAFQDSQRWLFILMQELERSSDRDGTPRRREAAEGEACQPGPPEEEASPND